MVDVQIHRAIGGRQQSSHRGPIAVAIFVEFVAADAEMAIGAAEHVLLLCNGAFDIGAAGNLRVRHVEDCEADAVLFGQIERNLTPVACNDGNLGFVVRPGRGPPPTQVVGREAVIPIGWLASIKRSQCLMQHLTSPA